MKCATIVKDFTSWVGEYSNVESIDENNCIITLPFRDPSNDAISLHLSKNSKDIFLISDVGEALGYLQTHAVNPSSERMDRLYNQLKNNFDINIEGEELIIENIAKENLNMKILDMIQGMTEIMNHRILAQMRASSIIDFKQEVTDQLENWNVKYESGYKMKGPTGEEFEIDFVVNGVFDPAVYIDTLFATSRSTGLNRLTKEMPKVLVFKEQHPNETFVVLMDDRDEEEEVWDGKYVEYLKMLNANPIFWKDDTNDFFEFLSNYTKVSKGTSLDDFPTE